MQHTYQNPQDNSWYETAPPENVNTKRTELALQLCTIPMLTVGEHRSRWPGTRRNVSTKSSVIPPATGHFLVHLAHHQLFVFVAEHLRRGQLKLREGPPELVLLHPQLRPRHVPHRRVILPVPEHAAVTHVLALAVHDAARTPPRSAGALCSRHRLRDARVARRRTTRTGRWPLGIPS